MGDKSARQSHNLIEVEVAQQTGHNRGLQFSDLSI